MKKAATTARYVTALLIYTAMFVLGALTLASAIVGAIQIWPLWEFYGGYAIGIGLVFRYLNSLAADIQRGNELNLISTKFFGIFKSLASNPPPDDVRIARLDRLGVKSRRLGRGWWMLWRPREWYAEKWSRLFRRKAA